MRVLAASYEVTLVVSSDAGGEKAGQNSTVKRRKRSAATKREPVRVQWTPMRGSRRVLRAMRRCGPPNRVERR